MIRDLEHLAYRTIGLFVCLTLFFIRPAEFGLIVILWACQYIQPRRLRARDDE